MTEFVRAADSWEAIYYPNPIPRSSQSLLAMALLFDRVHLPGMSLPLVAASDGDRTRLLKRIETDPELMAIRNLCLWAIECPVVADFIHLPDTHLSRAGIDALMKPAHQLLDDTYGEETSGQIITLNAVQVIRLPDSGRDGVRLDLATVPSTSTHVRG